MQLMLTLCLRLQVLTTLADSQHNQHDKYQLLWKQYWNSWWRTVDMSEKFRNIYQNKFENHSVYLKFIIRIYEYARSSECQIRKRRNLIPAFHDCKYQDSLRISLRVFQFPDAIMGHFIPLHMFCIMKMQVQQSHRESTYFRFSLTTTSSGENQERKSADFPPCISAVDTKLLQLIRSKSASTGNNSLNVLLN